MTGTDAAHGPTRTSASLAFIAAGVGGALAVAAAGWLVVLSPVGVALVGGGLWRGDRRIVAAGCAALVSSALAAGVAGARPIRLVAAVAATIAAWDCGERAIALGEQLGRRADTRRLELVGAGTTAAVTAVATAPIYALFVLAAGDRPLTALVLLLVGAAALLTVLGRR